MFLRSAGTALLAVGFILFILGTGIKYVKGNSTLTFKSLGVILLEVIIWLNSGKVSSTTNKRDRESGV